MSIIERAVTWALDRAADDSHGYDQSRRWGPDYDCSALVISAYRQAGVPLTCTYTGNMKRDMLAKGFVLVTDGTLKRGDVLLSEAHHTALYIGDGRLVHASINERGGVTGGQSGDQTGREICVRDYYDRPWDCVLRMAGLPGDDPAPADAVSGGETLPPAAPSSGGGAEAAQAAEGPILLKRGHKSGAVAALQHLLLYRGRALPRWGADGDFGDETEAALQTFQAAAALEADGICGPATWAALTKGRET